MSKIKTSDAHEKRCKDSIKALLYRLNDFSLAFPHSFKEFIQDVTIQSKIKAINSFVEAKKS